MLERLFHISQYRTSVRTEVLAGVTTFMTMAYIIIVNPAILAGSPSHPGPLGPSLFAPTVTATCLAAAIPTLLMGLWANYPFALASGMGLNAALVAAVGSGPGITWQVMMGVVFVEGAIVAVLVLTRLRQAVMQAIPLDLKRAIGVGIGLFIALLGMHNAHWISTSSAPVPGVPSTFTPTGNFHLAPTLLATFGVFVSALLLIRRVRGALLTGIALTTVAAMALHLQPLPQHVAAPPSFATIGKLSLSGVLTPAAIALVFAFMMSDFFDTMGTVIAIGEQAGYLDPDGSLPRLNRVLLVDALAAVWGGFCCASSSTTYIESAAGVGEGGRTGLTSVVVGFLFLASMFLAPLVQAVPAEATAAALILVGFMMMTVVKDINFGDAVSAIPAFLIMLLIPLTMSIARGIGIGFIAYVLFHALTGRAREVSPMLWGLAGLFALTFYFEHAPV
ncbi:MAG: NCS2 family permease [Chthonomonadales bacterium]